MNGLIELDEPLPSPPGHPFERIISIEDGDDPMAAEHRKGDDASRGQVSDPEVATAWHELLRR